MTQPAHEPNGSAFPARQFEIDSSVTLGRSPAFRQQLEGTLQSELRALAPLPEGFTLRFHNTQRPFYILGMPVTSSMTGRTTAELSYNPHGSAAAEDRYSNKIELCTYDGGSKLSGSLKGFIAKAHTLAHGRIDSLRYLRNELPPGAAVRMLCGWLRSHLQQTGFSAAKVGAIPHRGLGNRHPFNDPAGTVPVIFASAGDVKNIAGVLQSWLCAPGGAIPSRASRAEALAQEMSAKSGRPVNGRAGGSAALCEEDGALLYFDKRPILVMPVSELRTLARGAHGAFVRSRCTRALNYDPQLYDFYPDRILHGLLQPAIGAFDVMAAPPESMRETIEAIKKLRDSHDRHEA